MNILTFDIEDWYCHDNYSQDFNWSKHEVRIYEPLYRILEFLDEQNVKGTFFCLGWLAENHPKLITEIAKRGHHLGCHSYQHQLAYRFNKQEFYNDTYKAKSLLEDISGIEVNAFRAPSYSITRNNIYAFEALCELGFKYDSSVFPIKRECGGFDNFGEAKPTIVEIKGFYIKEFPMNTASLFGKSLVFSGGGYFRVLPYSVIKKLTNQSEYIMSYFHPSDFDPNQPKMRYLPLKRQIMNEICLKGTFDKFKQYVNDNQFETIETASEKIDWAIIPRISL